VPSIPTGFLGRVFARKTFSCAPETGKSIRSPVGIRKVYVDVPGFCVFRAHLHPWSLQLATRLLVSGLSRESNFLHLSL
jgi:hypothetical protein